MRYIIGHWILEQLNSGVWHGWDSRTSEPLTGDEIYEIICSSFPELCR